MKNSTKNYRVDLLIAEKFQRIFYFLNEGILDFFFFLLKNLEKKKKIYCSLKSADFPVTKTKEHEQT